MSTSTKNQFVMSLSSVNGESCSTLSERTPLLRDSQSSESKYASFLRTASTVSVLVFVSGLDMTLMAAIAPVVAKDLGDVSVSLYLSTVSLLCSTLATPVCAHSSDVWGRAWPTVVSCALYMLGTLICGAAPSIVVFLVGRGMIGFGVGGISIMSSIILSETVSLQSRALWHSVGKLIGGISMALGGPLGGYLSDTYGWRIAIFLQSPLALFSVLISLYSFREKRRICAFQEQNCPPPVKGLDLRGCLLLLITMVSVFLSLSAFSSSAATSLGYTSPRLSIAILVATSIFSAGCLIYVESTTLNPIISTRLFRSRHVASLCFLQFFSAFIHYSILYTVPMLATIIFHASAMSAGTHIMPVSLAAVLGTVLSGMRISRTGRYGTMLLLGAACVVLGPAAFTAIASLPSQRRPSIVLQMMATFPSTFGFQLINSASIVALLAVGNAVDIAGLTSHAALFKSLGGVLGTALSGVLIQAFLSAELSQRLSGDRRQYIDAIKMNGSDMSALPADVQEIGLQGWKHGFFSTFAVLALVSLINLVLPAFGVSEVIVAP